MVERYDNKDDWQSALAEKGYAKDTYVYWGYGSVEVFDATDECQRIAVWHGFYDCNVTEKAEHGYILDNNS